MLELNFNMWCLEGPEESEERQDSIPDKEAGVMSVQEISQDESCKGLQSFRLIPLGGTHWE